MAHNVRPDEYLEINNFYTAHRVREGRRGHPHAAHAARARALPPRHGPLLRAPRRHGGDLRRLRAGDAGRVAASTSRSSGAGTAQAGTPVVDACAARYDAAAQTYTLDVAQRTPPTPGQPDKLPFHIPFAVGLLDRDGRDIPLRLDGEAAPVGHHARARAARGAADVPLRRHRGAAGAVAAARILGAGERRVRLHRRRARVPRRARQRCRQPLGRRAAQLRQRDARARARPPRGPAARAAGVARRHRRHAARRPRERPGAARAGADAAGPGLRRGARAGHRRRRRRRRARLPACASSARALRAAVRARRIASAACARRTRRRPTRPARASSPTCACAISAAPTMPRRARSRSRTSTPPTT